MFNFQRFKKELESFRKRLTDNVCASALVVLSYGGKGTVMCEDGQMVTLQEIVDVFSKKNCPAQDGKPKLVLIHACGAKLKGMLIFHAHVHGVIVHYSFMLWRL